MTYPSNYIGIAVSQETHRRLTELKTKYNEVNFDSVVNKLLDLEEKYNMPTETFEYEFMLTGRKSKLFRVTYSNKVDIEYWNSNKMEFEKNIKAWLTGYKISKEDLDNFIKFIIKDSNLGLLYEMEKELVLNGLWIKRV